VRFRWREPVRVGTMRPAVPGQHQLVPRRTTSSDGTSLCYYVGGAADAPALLLVGGPLAPSGVWRSLLAYLGRRLRFVTWDGRGLFGSTPPRRTAGGYAMPLQVSDLHAVLGALGDKRIALLGFSFGVQLALEAYRELGDRVACMVLMSGSAGRPLEALGGLPGTGKPLRRALDWARHANGRLAQPLPRAVTGALVSLLAGPTLASDVRQDLVDALSAVPASALLDTLSTYAEHDASRSLDSVRAPTLIVTGERDPLAPPEIMQQVARHIPRSEILVVPRAHHLVFAEYPDLVNLRLERFFEDVGWC